jgi:hypothetical protein
LAIQQTTQSLQVATASLNEFSASTNAHIVGISDFTSSQLAVNLGNAIYTASVDSHIVGISTYTSSVRDTLARVHQATQSLQVATASIQIQTASLLAFTASQDGRNFVISQVTGSLIGITNGLMAFTAALDNTYATDAQLYQLYQATRSLELHSGSMIGVTNGLMAYTASNNTLNTGLRDEVNGIEAYTSSLKAAISVSGTNVQIIGDLNVNKLNVQYISSSVLVTSGSNTFGDQSTDKHEFTGSVYLQNSLIIGTEVLGNAGLNSFTASTNNSIVGVSQFTSSQLDVNLQNSIVTSSFRIELNSIEEYTASLKGQAIVSSSTQIQNYDVFALNSNLYNGTGSIKGEVAGIEAYTASLKGAAIVSSSQQITNYYKFAETASANTFYGDQTITGSLAIKDSETNFLIEGNGFSQTYLTSNGAIVLNPGFGGVEMVGSYRTFKATDITADGFVSGEIRATNNVVSSSVQITELAPLMQATASLNTYTGSNNSVVARILQTTASLNTLTGSIGAVVNSVMAYTASLKSAFSVSGTTTTHNGIIDTSENLLYSKRTSPANVNSGATTVFTITQKSGEFQSTYMVSIVGLYDSGGSNQNGFYTGFVTFFTDGAIAQANISAIHSNGWSASAAATTGGSFTITFTNGAATTMTNVRITALKINAT